MARFREAVRQSKDRMQEYVVFYNIIGASSDLLHEIVMARRPSEAETKWRNAHISTLHRFSHAVLRKKTRY